MDINSVNFVCGTIGLLAIFYLMARNKINWWVSFFLGMFFVIMACGAVGLIASSLNIFN